jgi:hypothetical protein
MKTQMCSRGVTLLFLYPRWGLVFNATLLPLYPWDGYVVLMVQGARWAPEAAWTNVAI